MMEIQRVKRKARTLFFFDERGTWEVVTIPMKSQIQSLKAARKEARELISHSGYGCCFISLNKANGYYATQAHDNYSKYFVHKDGSLEELSLRWTYK